MNGQRVAIMVGATGTVGRGIVRTLAGAGWRVIAVARDQARLGALAAAVPGIATVAGAVDSDAVAQATAQRVGALAVRADAVVTAVNIPPAPITLLDCADADLLAVIRGNLLPHLSTARAFLPLLAPGGRYIGIGGGMADFTFPGVGPVSICQAAQRNMFRFLAMEAAERGQSVAELMLYSQIVDPADEESASPRDIRADEVGEHLRAVLEQPDVFPGPILTLKSRKQIGQPERV